VKKEETKFYYNPKTLRYERVRISAINVALTALSLLLFGCAFFIGLVFLQNYLVQTPLEKALKTENKALKEHQIIIAARLDEARNQLQNLKERDTQFYEDIFAAPRTEEVSELEKEDILLADINGFHDWAGSLDSKIEKSKKKAFAWDFIFRSKASVKKEDVKLLQAAPTVVPLENFDADKMVSGFGVRVNPFHKGKYHHDGVDLAAPIGTKVLAGGPGRVVLVNNSNLVAGYGNYIEIDHGFGYLTRYTHLSTLSVHYGQKVKEGQAIGTVGMSGGVIAPHLHYEVLKDGEKLDPVKFMISGLTTEKYDLMLKASKKINQSLD